MTSGKAKSQREGRPLAWRREALGGDAGWACSRSSSKRVRSLAPPAINEGCWDISPHPVQHKRDQQPAKNHPTGGEKRTERRGEKRWATCEPSPPRLGLRIVKLLNKMHHHLSPASPSPLEAQWAEGCSVEAKILGPTFARNGAGLPNQ